MTNIEFHSVTKEYKFDTQKHGDDVRRIIGYLPQELNMYPSLSVFDFVSYMASLKGIKDQKQIKAVLEQVDIAQVRNTAYRPAFRRHEAACGDCTSPCRQP